MHGRAGVCLLLALALALALAAACGEVHEPDPRFATPEATLRTLMTTYGVEDMSQEDIQQIMRDRGRFRLRDEQTYRACFDDWEGPHHEGFAGFVFGTVAAGKDQLEVTHVQGKAHVFPNPERRDRSVVLVQRDGAWKISLRESVPSDVRTALLEEYRRVSDRNRRAGARE